MRPTIDGTIGDGVALVVRTDYSDDGAWRTVRALLVAPQPYGFEPANHFVDDIAWHGASVAEVLAAVPESESVVFVADAESMRSPHPLLAVNTVTRQDCADDEEFAYELAYGREFRVLPAGVVDVSTNLFIANMDFPEFAAMARRDTTGRYRGLAATQKGTAALAALRDAKQRESGTSGSHHGERC